MSRSQGGTIQIGAALPTRSHTANSLIMNSLSAKKEMAAYPHPKLFEQMFQKVVFCRQEL
jgi:hypothetical protein